MLDFKFLGANGSIQEKGSLNTSLLFSDSKETVLVDVSSNIYEAVERKICALFITHNHIDHMYGLPSLIHQMWLCNRTEKLDIICPSSLVEMVENLMGVFAIRAKKNMFEINVIPASKHTYGTMTFETFKTDHTDDSFGMVVCSNNEKIVYTSDTRPIHDADKSWIGADILIHETSGLFNNEETLIKKGHSSAADAAILAKQIDAKKLIICHLPVGTEAKNSILKEARTTYKNTFLASDFIV